MPLWQIYHHPDAFAKDQKRQLSKAITTIYSDQTNVKAPRTVLPKFYVIVVFEPMENIYVGGEEETKFVRIVVSHLARESRLEEDAARSFQDLVDSTLKPFIDDRGMTWEYHYNNSPRMWWKVNGMVPPAADSDAEKLWIRENKAVPYY